MRSIDAPMMAMSRAARSSMRSTAPASQVGLSHSTQLRSPSSIASGSNGRLAGFMASLNVRTDLTHDNARYPREHDPEKRKPVFPRTNAKRLPGDHAQTKR